MAEPIDVTIRPETADDAAAVRRVNQAAFPTSEEANLVDALRAEGVVLLSLVAERAGEVIGHILFTRMWVDAATGAIDTVALAPVAVVPAYQRRGVGSALIRAGLEMLRDRGERLVVLVGHPEYYPRFGFSSAAAGVLEHPFSPEAFMTLALSPDALDGVRGRVRYARAFGL